MTKRIITSVIGLPLLIAVIYLGGFWLRAGLLLLSVIGLFEFYRALSGKSLLIHFTGYFFSAVYLLYIVDIGVHDHFLVMLSAFILLTLVATVVFYQKIKFADCLITISGFFYVTFLLSFIYFVRGNSVYFVWLIFTSASTSDTFAYLVGRKWGRHKLAGTPSPGKTWEGCIGGILGAAIVGFIYGQVVIHFIGIEHPIVLHAMAVSVVGAVFSQFGDLFASAVKRSVGIKDFGKILPGHGGILDRFDGIMAAAPVVYMVMIFI